jgi:nitrate/nitrite transporter NarK
VLSLLPLLAHDLTATIVLLTIASTTVFVTIPLLWSLASDYFAGSPAAAPAIAFVNSLGLLGGFASPFAMGWLKTLSGTLNSGLFLMTTLLALGACAMLCVRVGRQASR